MADIDAQLKTLTAMSPSELKTEWRRVHKAPPPSITPDLLRRGIAYKLQEQVHGGLTTAVSRELDQIAKRIQRGDSPLPSSALRMKPGTRLLREWQGKTHCVLVVDSGFIFEDRLFSSLSTIAHAITGTSWSGPRFFGLLSKRAAHD